MLMFKTQSTEAGESQQLELEAAGCIVPTVMQLSETNKCMLVLRLLLPSSIVQNLPT